MSDLECTPAGLQLVIPGCERRTLPRSTTRVDDIGQGLFSFYRLQTREPAREAREPRGCTFAAEQRTKGTAEEWFVQLLNCSNRAQQLQQSLCVATRCGVNPELR